MALVEYLEVALHGDPGTTEPPGDKSELPIGLGNDGYVRKLNDLALQGWRMIWMDRDTTVRVIAILEREIPVGAREPARREADDRDLSHG